MNVGRMTGKMADARKVEKNKEEDLDYTKRAGRGDM